MIKVVAEIPGFELPQSLARLLPEGCAASEARFRVTVELIADDQESASSLALGLTGIAAGLADLDAGRLISEEDLFARLLAKYASPEL